MTREELNERIQERMHQPMIADGVRLVQNAKDYALKMHGSQLYGNEPYSVHLEAVESVLIEFNHFSSAFRAAAWLHDVVEDVEELKDPASSARQAFNQKFPSMVVLMVESVTVEPGKNRKERNGKTYPKIAALRSAVILKLADRIANVRRSKVSGDLKENGDSNFSMYKKEYSDFRAALYFTDIEIMPMWWELDRLLDYQGV